ncbi:hypothetical protein [uncultured Porphyromonas sp.]|nr:hypothetical protein [uncultured Porphyromonas sp.]
MDGRKRDESLRRGGWEIGSQISRLLLKQANAIRDSQNKLW